LKKEKIGGLITFSLGIGLLCFTFYVALITFNSPEKIAPFGQLIPNSSEFGGITKVGGYLIAFLLLWIMGSVAGKITKYGIELYIHTKEKSEKTS
jgi:hypothetical protein